MAAPPPTIEYSIIDVLSGSYVFGVSSSGNPKIYKSTVRSASGAALYAQSSSGYISVHDSDIIQTSSNPAVMAIGGSSIGFWIAATIYDGKNKVKGGKLHADGNAIINASEASGSKDKNHFCDAASATLEVGSGGTIYARYDYWPNGDPPTQINNGGSIYYSNNLGASDCSDVSMMVAKTGLSDQGVQLVGTATIQPGAFLVSGDASDVHALLFEAKDKVRAGLYAEAAALFKQIIQSEKMPEAHTALLELGLLFRESPGHEIPAFVQALANQDGTLKTTAKKALAGIYAFQKQESEALQILDELARLYPGTPDAFFAQLNKFYLYVEMGDYDKAAQVLDEMQPQNEVEAISSAAARQLLNLETGNTQLSKPATHPMENSSAPISTASTASEQVGLQVSSYPNPFNPATKIRFYLSENQNVRLVIFDLTGQLVRTLVEDELPAGEQTISWDGRDQDGMLAASGIYFYELVLGNKVERQKMTLIR